MRENRHAREFREQALEGNDVTREVSLLRGALEVFQFHGLIQSEFAHRGAHDFGEVRAAAQRRAHVVRERTDVGAGGALDRNFRQRAGNFVDVKIVDFDLHRFQFHRFFLAREFVRRAAVNFLRGIRRRHLRKAADARGGEPLDFSAIDLRSRVRAKRRAIGVVGVRGEAEAERGVVAFAASHVKLREARGAPEQQHQNARRQRIERARDGRFAGSRRCGARLRPRRATSCRAACQ